MAASESLNSVMGEELQLKIAENAKLHAALDGVDAKHAEEISGLQSKISELESRVTKRAQADRSEDTRLKDMLQVSGIILTERSKVLAYLKVIAHNLQLQFNSNATLNIKLTKLCKRNERQRQFNTQTFGNFYSSDDT